MTCTLRTAFFIVAALSGLQGTVAAPPKAPALKKAVDLACNYLRSNQRTDGTWAMYGSHVLGETSLACMALSAAGDPTQTPAIQSALNAIRKLASTDTNTYDVSLAIMCLHSLGAEGDQGLLKQLGTRLSAGQCGNGSWSYSVPAQSDQPVPSLGAAGDNSNTQFAALATWISRDYGVDNDNNLTLLDQYFRGSVTQRQDAVGWAYAGGQGPTATMTCAGLVGLATYLGIERAGNARAAATDPLAKQALTSLGKGLLVAKNNPTDPLNRDLYFFWSLERVGVIYGVENIGQVNWYKWGSEKLLEFQGPDGQWSGRSCTKGWKYSGNVGTSFGILFLTRANAAGGLSERVGGQTGAHSPSKTRQEGKGNLNIKLPERGGNGGGSNFFRRGGQPNSPQPRTAPPQTSSPPSNLDPRNRRPPPPIEPQGPPRPN